MGSFSFCHLVKGSDMIILLHCAGIIGGRVPWLSKYSIIPKWFLLHSLRACLFEVSSVWESLSLSLVIHHRS